MSWQVPSEWIGNRRGSDWRRIIRSTKSTSSSSFWWSCSWFVFGNLWTTMGIWVYFHNPTSVVTLLKRTCWNTLIWKAMKSTFWRPTMGTAVSIHLFELFKVLLIFLLPKERSKSLYPFHSLSLWIFFCPNVNNCFLWLPDQQSYKDKGEQQPTGFNLFIYFFLWRRKFNPQFWWFKRWIRR